MKRKKYFGTIIDDGIVLVAFRISQQVLEISLIKLRSSQANFRTYTLLHPLRSAAASQANPSLESPFISAIML